MFNTQRDMLEVAANTPISSPTESCGFCTPCRVGCGQLVDTADRLVNGHASEIDVHRLKETGDLMHPCQPLRFGADRRHPLLDVLAHFPELVSSTPGAMHAQTFDLEAAVVNMQAP